MYSSEPPAKRMRLLHTIEVDEDNPDYIRSSEKSRDKLKNSFESIFARFADLPDEKSDVIEIGGKINLLVDNGHLRSHKHKIGGILDDFLDAGKQSHMMELDEDSEDELAPPMVHATPLATGRKKTQDAHPLSERQQQTPLQATEETRVVMPPPALNQTQLLNALGSALQTPQIPANAHDQNALLMGLGQFVLQAVAQVLPQAQTLCSNLAGPQMNTPSNAPALQSVATPSTTSILAPATDPKWYFPSLPENPNVSLHAQSSPIRPLKTARVPRKSLSSTLITRPSNSSPRARFPVETPALSTATEHSSEVNNADEEVSSTDEPPKDWSRCPEQPRRKRRCLYNFTDEDDAHILLRRTVQKQPWPKIKNSQPKWKNWPLSAFRNHWTLKLRHVSEMQSQAQDSQDSLAQSLETSVVSEEDIQCDIAHNSRHESLDSTSEPRQLLTPSSTEHAEHSELQRLIEGSVAQGPESTLSDEDRELLSLLGVDNEQQGQREEDDNDRDELEPEISQSRSDVQSDCESHDESEPEIQETPPISSSQFLPASSLPPEDAIMQSIEIPDLWSAECEQPHVPTPLRTPSKVEVKIPYKPVEIHYKSHSSSMVPPRPKPKPLEDECEDELSLLPTGEDDELATPFSSASIKVKRERLSPSPSMLFATPGPFSTSKFKSFKTPKSAPHPRLHALSSSDRKYTPGSGLGLKATPGPKMSKKEFHKLARKSWGKQGSGRRKSRGQLVSMRSFEVLGKRKVGDREEEDSGDELAM